MSKQAIIDYLTKKLYIEKAIVTYRLLSREFSIHVNAAKNELAKFHAEGPSLSHPVESFATYLVSGELPSLVKSPPSSYNVEDEDDNPYSQEEEKKNRPEGNNFEFGDSEEVPQFQMMLVGEANLEATKARFKKVHSVQVYCLTPSPLRDSRLVCTSTDQVREKDNNMGQEMAKVVGKVMGAPLQYIIEPFKTVSISSKPKINSAAKKEEAKSKALQITKDEKQQVKPKEEEKQPAVKPVEKAKPAGKHDFFKPKPKETKKEEKPKDLSAPKAFFNVPKKETAQKETAGPSRGTKRKSIAPSIKSESEDEARSTSTVQSTIVSKPKGTSVVAKTVSGPVKIAARVKKGVVLSDDEEDAPPLPRRKSKIFVGADNDAARALMDIDDEHVTRASRSGDPAEKERVNTGAIEQEKIETPVASDIDEDVEMDDEEQPKPKPKQSKQRKPRKVVPVGRNGLKKNRIVKSRTKMDEKGYMATEDYSSYESVEEEAEPAPAKNKGKAKAKAAVETNDSGVGVSDAKVAGKGKAKAETVKAKTTGKQLKGQGSLVSFFGPPKTKR
ncbi:DNA polymerase subunit Cdc27 [Amanita muscaria]